MAKKKTTTKKTSKETVATAPSTDETPKSKKGRASDFREALKKELGKNANAMSPAELDVWIEKTAVGKAIMNAYLTIHGS